MTGRSFRLTPSAASFRTSGLVRFYRFAAIKALVVSRFWDLLPASMRDHDQIHGAMSRLLLTGATLKHHQQFRRLPQLFDIWAEVLFGKHCDAAPCVEAVRTG